MNGSLDANIRRHLLPALKASQGRQGSYMRGGTVYALIAVPVNMAWQSETDNGAAIEQETEMDFLIETADFAALCIGTPQDGDRYTTILGDNVAQDLDGCPPRKRTPLETGRHGHELPNPYEVGAGMTAAASYAKQIATDVIAQMAAEGHPAWTVPMSAEFDRMYIDNLETMAPAGGVTTAMQVVFAPVEPKVERTGGGGVRITISMGILFSVMVQKQNGVVTDPNIDAYEQLIDQFLTWIMGPRTFAGGFSAFEPIAVFGDHYNSHLDRKSEFHVPVLVDFFADWTVS